MDSTCHSSGITSHTNSIFDPNAGSMCNFNTFYLIIRASIKSINTWTTFDIDFANSKYNIQRTWQHIKIIAI